MDETRAVARLPHLDVEILHRRLQGGEQLGIILRATPSAAAFARHLAAHAALWPWLALKTWLGWQRLLQVAWQLWLPADEPGMSAGVAQGPTDRHG
jgi:hypothetical protein